MYKHISPTIIQQSMFNNQDMIKEFIALYRTQTPIDFKKIEIAVIEQQFQKICDAAHHIKPTMEYIGASHIKDALQEIETLAQENKEFSIIQNEFETLKSHFTELFMELEQYETSL